MFVKPFEIKPQQKLRQLDLNTRPNGLDSLSFTPITLMKTSFVLVGV